MGESGPLKAMDFWEQHEWVSPPPSPLAVS